MIAQPPINDRQKWNATHNPRSISRGHCGCGGTHVGSVVSTIRNPSRIGADVSPTSLKLAGQTIAPSLFSRIPMQRRGSRPMAAQSCPRKPINQLITYRDHLSRLSSVRVLVGFDPNENGLTHEAKSLSSEGKAYD